jgi:hypothetical protein
VPGLLVELYSGHCCMYSCNDGGHGCILRWPPFYRCNGHFLNLAPRFRVIDPPDRPGLNLRLVVRVNNPICHQNEPKNVHYLPVVTPRMVLQDAPDNDFQVLGPFARSCARPHCPSKVRERRQSAACDLGICGHMRFVATFDPGDTLRPPPRPPGHHCLGVSDFPAAEEVYKIVHTPPGGRPGSQTTPITLKSSPG